MDQQQSLPELVSAAQKDAKLHEERISALRSEAEHTDGSQALRDETVALELAAVDIFSVFEARMQHHFKRGPFSRKLKAMLLEHGQTDLADRVHLFYLAINVLKHGKGASYRELLKTPSTLFEMKPATVAASDDCEARESLISIQVPGFFEALTATILEAYDFLEAR